MMTLQINWMAYTQAIRGGAMQTEGNAVADYESVADAASSGVAPEGAQYASLYSDVATVITVNDVGRNGQTETIFDGKDIYLPANTVIQVPNVIPKLTTFDVNDV